MGIDPKKWMRQIDWKLLVLLILFLNVKLAVKIPVIVIIYLLRPDFKFGFRFKNSRLPLFYLLIIGIAFIGALANKSYQDPHYSVVFLTGIVFWVLGLLAIHQVKLSVEKQDISTIHNTILLFFIINAIVSVLNLASIIWETGAFNPYLYQGLYQKYFIGTGDYIKGVTFDTSTTNAVINAIGILYFLTRKHYLMLIVCMVILLLTGSNFLNITLLLILGVLFIFKSTRDQKSMIMICVGLLIVFMVKISPQNNKYVNETLNRAFEKQTTQTNKPVTIVNPVEQRPDSLLNPEEIKEKIAKLYLDSLRMIKHRELTKNQPKPKDTVVIKDDKGRILVPQDNIHSAPFQSIKTTVPAQHPMLVFITNHKDSLPYSAGAIAAPKLPGKAVGLIQTAKFLSRHPAKFIAGNGMGNFSSKLAFRATGLGFSGSFPHRYIYINPNFLLNHLDLYLYYFSKQSGYHSLTNSPFSVYDQILAEYGILGLIALLVYYLWFFFKHYKRLTYGLPVFFLMLAILFIDYWFEQLSVLIFLELVLLLNIKETSIKMPEELTND